MRGTFPERAHALARRIFSQLVHDVVGHRFCFAFHQRLPAAPQRRVRWSVKRAASSSILFWGAVLGACGDDLTSLPQPQPIPGLVRRSTPGLSVPDPQTLVLGLPGAVPGLGELELRRVSDALRVTAPSSAKGSFSLVIGAAQGDLLELRFRVGEGASEALVLGPVFATRGPLLVPPIGQKGGPVSAPDASGQVTVTNNSGLPDPLFHASPGSEVLVSNETKAAVATGTTDGDGLFRLQLPGSTGDTIRVLLAASTNQDSTSDFLTFTVP
jgi:hypothetical protein